VAAAAAAAAAGADISSHVVICSASFMVRIMNGRARAIPTTNASSAAKPPNPNARAAGVLSSAPIAPPDNR